jgi:basic membrane protein A and related proteins
MVGRAHDRCFGRKLIRKGQIMLHSRRSFIAGILGTASALAFGLANRATSAAGLLQVALLTPGLINDGSFNQVALEAVAKLKHDGLIRYQVREKMRDPSASEPIIRQYAARKYDLIIGHGIELSEPILNVAKDFSSIHFAASGGPDLAGKLLPNVDGWTYDFAQQGFLSGWVAGKLIGIRKVGMVGGPQLPFILASHKGFKAGLAATNPHAQVIESFTGSFDDVQRAVEATRGLISQGAQVVWTSGDGIGNGVAAAANQAGIYTLGVTGSAGGLAEKVNIASVELNMYPTFRAYVDAVKAGNFGKRFFVSGLANKGLVLSKVNRVGKVVPPHLEKEVSLLVADLASGKKTLPDFFAK